MSDRRELWKRYAETILEFGSGADLRIDLRRKPTAEQRAALTALGLQGCFAVVTACNPEGRELSAETNRERTRDLQREIASAAGTCLRADGVSVDGSHRETGVAIVCEKQRAIDLGRRHGQLAIYWYDGRRFWLVPCDASRCPSALPAAQ